ncbi:GNAT family N-acetyltransferase [Chryseobacterium carnipullorum]|uniref:Acetyltransferase (GNAT) family n=1 Tax=Chryseobacterium carnipullorum TaxID=1124835 RepID=A0A1M7DCA0_CHRCU|nr:GNAT family N-acetyltransferase [Chryseobacterium carnipullorum]MDN5478536.1 GNAT family N-acetyltransferase [Chryseobacterium sp.]AZA50346.1 GNAT family N-acetyltransferase [Chryseobacterium carnipullorum]AZA65220.1 GNAT family N-acetyltransferase [Chryseobacterium carnipullorum]SHL76829.1 Acetyltransferase (GNAT) family protein [Chryseobacterium carnipullorum]STC98801.1 Acetyltransferase (GNAT) family [Chryseobacterium carnipullorum]
MNLETKLRKAEMEDRNEIWDIIQQSIERRKQDGSTQWQNGYPNMGTVESDIAKGFGYVLTIDGEIAVYAALILNDEPAYSTIEGAWLSDGEFLVVHRVAVDAKFAGRGMVKKLFDHIEEVTKSHGIQSIKVDTNYDNMAMLKILESKGYSYCGEVLLADGMRKAYEKIII